MSNKILIKHGAGKPEGKLAEYELGYSDDKEIIYFNSNNNNKEIIPISAGYAIKKVNKLPDDAEDRVIYMVPSVGDNNELTYNVSSSQPEDTSKLWIDISSDYPLLKFYDTSNRTWKNIASIWA